MRWVRWLPAMILVASGFAAQAQVADKISVEFNDLQPADTGCRAVFVLHNGIGKDLDKLAFRIVAFDTAEHATLFLSLDVGALPVDKTRVFRFDLGSDVACSDVSRLILDDVTACEGPDLEPGACLGLVALSTKAAVPLVY
jgi:hypothetical protein